MLDIGRVMSELPAELQQQVVDFADELRTRAHRNVNGAASFEWAGALKDTDKGLSSVDVQHAIGQYREQQP